MTKILRAVLSLGFVTMLKLMVMLKQGTVAILLGNIEDLQIDIVKSKLY